MTIVRVLTLLTQGLEQQSIYFQPFTPGQEAGDISEGIVLQKTHNGTCPGCKWFACEYGRENCELQSEGLWYKVTSSWVGPSEVSSSVSLCPGTCMSVSHAGSNHNLAPSSEETVKSSFFLWKKAWQWQQT